MIKQNLKEVVTPTTKKIEEIKVISEEVVLVAAAATVAHLLKAPHLVFLLPILGHTVKEAHTVKKADPSVQQIVQFLQEKFPWMVGPYL